MYIQRRQLWWLLPIFLSLLLLGISLAKLTAEPLPSDQQAVQHTDVTKSNDSNRLVVEKLIAQLEANQPIAYQVESQNQVYQGFFRKEAFNLTGKVSGHSINMMRANDKLTLKIDGKEQNADFLPYALFTPYEHAMVIQEQLPSISPQVLEDHSRNGRKGYRFTLPPNQIREMLSLWLGPQFQADDVMTDYMQDVVIRYELWYDTNDQHVKQLVVDLEVRQSQKPKHDQIIFRFS